MYGHKLLLPFVLLLPLLFSFFVLGHTFMIVQALAVKQAVGTLTCYTSIITAVCAHCSLSVSMHWPRPYLFPCGEHSVHLMSLLLRLGGCSTYTWRGMVPPPDIYWEENLRIGLQSLGVFPMSDLLVAFGVAFGSTLPVNRP